MEPGKVAPPQPAWCRRCLVLCILLLGGLPWLFWWGVDLRTEFEADPRAYYTCLSIYVALLAVTGILARFPGRLAILREFVFSLAVAMAAIAVLENLPNVVQEGGRGLVFAPNSAASYKNSEFQVVVRANNLGLRDRPMTMEKSRKYRILAVGDSFTYGWGVDTAECWTEQLEAALIEHGVDAEVVNMGQPGASPYHYIDMVRRGVPLLKPDLIIVALTQENDLYQTEPGWRPSVYRSFLSRPLVFLYPNLSSVLHQRRRRDEVNDVHRAWFDQMGEFLHSLSPEQKQKYMQLDADVRKLYETGMLNPSILSDYLHRNDRLLLPPDGPRVERQVERLGYVLARIRNIGAEHGARTMAISIPCGGYTNKAAIRGQKRLGFAVPQDALTSDFVDRSMRRAANIADVPFYDYTAAFRDRADMPDLYFVLDGHMAAPGYRLLASLLRPDVMARLK